MRLTGTNVVSPCSDVTRVVVTDAADEVVDKETYNCILVRELGHARATADQEGGARNEIGISKAPFVAARLSCRHPSVLVLSSNR